VTVYSSLEEERLGSGLRRAGLVTREQLEEALTAIRARTATGLQPTGGTHASLGDELVRRGWVQPHRLLHHLTEQLQEKLAQLLYVSDGEWAWWQGERTEVEPLPMTTDLPALINRTLLEHVTATLCRRYFDGHEHDALHRLLRLDQLTQIQLAPRALRLASLLHEDDTPGLLVDRLASAPGWKESELWQYLFLLHEFEAIGLRSDPRNLLPG
jgi:hypothetical protein